MRGFYVLHGISENGAGEGVEAVNSGAHGVLDASSKPCSPTPLAGGKGDATPIAVTDNKGEAEVRLVNRGNAIRHVETELDVLGWSFGLDALGW